MLSGQRSLFGGGETFNLERAAFDQMLLDEAEAAGAAVFHDAGVTRVVQLADGDVRARVE